jgi:Zn finger protein HypA/HybF involved in hydrogenase expression
MHELSIEESLLDVALEQCDSKGFCTIGGTKVLIGKESGVMPDALLFNKIIWNEYSEL